MKVIYDGVTLDQGWATSVAVHQVMIGYMWLSSFSPEHHEGDCLQQRRHEGGRQMQEARRHLRDEHAKMISSYVRL